jgi:acyl transferase domain-containing protein
MGHSIGEYVAACIAGILSLEDALALVTTRGQLMQELPERGSMLTVLADLSTWEDLLTPFQQEISIAALNGPQHVVLSGIEKALRTVTQLLQERGIPTRSLAVSHAFHSPCLDPMLDTFEHYAQTLTFQPARIPFVSNLTGTIIPIGASVDAHYWRRHTRKTVQFATGIQTLLAQGTTDFIEIGPHATLITMAQIGLSHTTEQETVTRNWYTSLYKGQENWQTLLTTVAALYTQGVNFDWSGFDRDYRRQRVPIPEHPFIRQRYWLTTKQDSSDVLPALTHMVSENPKGRHPYLDNYKIRLSAANIHIWESCLDAARLPLLQQHRLQGTTAFSLFTYAEIALAAAAEAFGQASYRLHQLQIAKMLLLPEHESRKIQFILEAKGEQKIEFRLYSHMDTHIPEDDERAWTLHATGMLQKVEKEGIKCKK